VIVAEVELAGAQLYCAGKSAGADDLAHSHSHDSTPDSEQRLGRAFVLIAAFMFVEIAGGLVANSLTLLADAGHMFLDASALAFSWYAMRISQRVQDERLTYGYHRWQVLAAFVNGLTLMGLVAWVLLEAYSRLVNPEQMLPLPALAVATVGLIVNLIAFRWLHGAQPNANVASAALHVLGDLLGSAAAIVAALTVWLTGWLYADPLLALLIAAILGRGAWRVLRQSAHILLEGVPDGLQLGTIAATLTRKVAGVNDVHHLHAWALTAEKPLLTLHATVDQPVDLEQVVVQIKRVLNDDFGIDHSTIQVEHGACPDH
jgi:cobalt-zinc-cadmium efflux system protein